MNLKKICSLIALVICVCALIASFIMLVMMPHVTTIHNDPETNTTNIQSVSADKHIKTDYTIEDIKDLAVSYLSAEQVSVLWNGDNNSYNLFIDYESNGIDVSCNIFNKSSITELYNALLSYISKNGSL